MMAQPKPGPQTGAARSFADRLAVLGISGLCCGLKYSNYMPESQ